MPRKGISPALNECDRRLTGGADPYPYGTTKIFVMQRRGDGLSVRQIHEDLCREIRQAHEGAEPFPSPPSAAAVALWVRGWEGNPVIRVIYRKKEKAVNAS